MHACTCCLYLRVVRAAPPTGLKGYLRPKEYSLTFVLLDRLIHDHPRPVSVCIIFSRVFWLSFMTQSARQQIMCHADLVLRCQTAFFFYMGTGKRVWWTAYTIFCSADPEFLRVVDWPLISVKHDYKEIQLRDDITNLTKHRFDFVKLSPICKPLLQSAANQRPAETEDLQNKNSTGCSPDPFSRAHIKEKSGLATQD